MQELEVRMVEEMEVFTYSMNKGGKTMKIVFKNATQIEHIASIYESKENINGEMRSILIIRFDSKNSYEYAEIKRLFSDKNALQEINIYSEVMDDSKSTSRFEGIQFNYTELQKIMVELAESENAFVVYLMKKSNYEIQLEATQQQYEMLMNGLLELANIVGE